MNLPDSRNTSYAPNQPIKSADLNALQDCIIDGKHGVITPWFAPIGGSASPSNTGGLGSTSHVIPVPFMFPPGAEILQVFMRAFGDPAATLTFTLNMCADDGAVSSLNVQAINQAAAWATFSGVAGSLILTAPRVLVADCVVPAGKIGGLAIGFHVP